jgi:hypothetical protein
MGCRPRLSKIPENAKNSSEPAEIGFYLSACKATRGNGTRANVVEDT